MEGVEASFAGKLRRTGPVSGVKSDQAVFEVAISRHPLRLVGGAQEDTPTLATAVAICEQTVAYEPKTATEVFSPLTFPDSVF